MNRLDEQTATVMSNKNNGFAVKGLFIWSLTTLYYAFDNLLNVSPAAMKPELSQAFSTSAAELGALSACYLWAYGLMQIPAGLLMDKYGPRRIFAVASFLCMLGTLLFSQADALFMAKLGRIFIGIGASVAVVGCSKIAAVWFPPKRFALFAGLMVSVGMLGAAFGLSTVSNIVQWLGWQKSMQWGAWIAGGLCLMLWLVVRDKPIQQHIYVESSAKQVELFKSFKAVMSCSQGWIASIFAALMFVPTLAFGALWGVPYLVEAHGFARDTAGQLVALIFVGWALGAPLFGWISDYIGRRNLPMYVANLVTILICLILIYKPDLSQFNIAILMFFLGYFSSGFILAFAVVREKHHHSVSATAIGFINTLNTFGGAALQFGIGKLLDVTSQESIVSNGDMVFSLADYQRALVSLPICLVIALIMLMRLKETYCRPVQHITKAEPALA